MKNKPLNKYSRSELKFFIKESLNLMPNDKFSYYMNEFNKCENDKVKLYQLAKRLNK